MPSKPEDPLILPSGGSLEKQSNPDGNISQISEKIRGPFSKDGMIGSQFNAAKGGIVDTIERTVDGPSRRKTGEQELKAGEKAPNMQSSKK